MQIVGTPPALHPVKDVKPNNWNPNKMSAREFESTCAGIEKDGWLMSHTLLIWRTDDAGNVRNLIIDGEHRWRAARKLKIRQVPMVFLDGIPEPEAEKLTIKLFQRRGTPDEGKLIDLLTELYDPGDDLKAAALDLGFEDDEFMRLLGIGESAVGRDDEPSEDVPELPVDPITKDGDVWVLGKHRLVCGDARQPGVLQAALNGALADMVLTDPPYGVDYVGKTSKKLPVHNDGKAGLEDLLRGVLTDVAGHCKAGGAWYICAPAGPNFLEFAKVLTELEVWRQTIVWVKNVLVMGRSDYHYRHEAIFYGWKPGAAHRGLPDRKQDTVWEFDKPRASEDHPTTKPIPLFQRAVENSSSPGDVVVDPFSGSGTTLLTCEMTGRVAACIELSPAYCDVIVRRWEEYTKLKAERITKD